MKKYLSLVLAATLGAGLAGGQTTTNNFSFLANRAIPDADANGLALATNITGLSGTIVNLTVTLNLTNGFNGDLYAYLAGPNGGFAVLLNRAGVGSTSSAGYNNAGFNVTLDDAAGNNIHYYQSAGYALDGGGQLTGPWTPDGRNIDPQSPPATFDATPSTALLNSFIGANPNGTWTLFLADLAGGGQSTIVNWGLNLTTVPEPGAAALGLLALALLASFKLKRN